MKPQRHRIIRQALDRPRRRPRPCPALGRSLGAAQSRLQDSRDLAVAHGGMQLRAPSAQQSVMPNGLNPRCSARAHRSDASALGRSLVPASRKRRFGLLVPPDADARDALAPCEGIARRKGPRHVHRPCVGGRKVLHGSQGAGRAAGAYSCLGLPAARVPVQMMTAATATAMKTNLVFAMGPRTALVCIGL